MNTAFISIELPAEDWISGNCFFKGEIEVEPEGEAGLGERVPVRFSGLYPGRHVFFSPATGLELHIYADKKGGCRYVCDSLANFASQ
jgi:hypothetical protein